MSSNKIKQLEEQQDDVIKPEELPGTMSKDVKVVGVDNNGNGVSATMRVEVKPGSGLVLVNINNLLADYLTQISARNAAEVASNITNTNLQNIDVIYNIKANATVIEGPSAGSAMAVATIAALENKSMIEDAIITGTIEKDGSINVVGGIKEKARAAKSAGAKKLLIPKADYINDYEQIKSCRNIKNLEYCEIRYIPKTADLDKELGIKIIQIQNIKEVIPHMIAWKTTNH